MAQAMEKKKRGIAKGRFTRQENLLTNMLDNNAANNAGHHCSPVREVRGKLEQSGSGTGYLHGGSRF